MRISDWSSDVCSSDLIDVEFGTPPIDLIRPTLTPLLDKFGAVPVAHLRAKTIFAHLAHGEHDMGVRFGETVRADVPMDIEVGDHAAFDPSRSEGHTSKLQSLLRHSSTRVWLQQK